MSELTATEHLGAANLLLQETKSAINSLNVYENESAAVSSLQNLCDCFNHLGKVRDIDPSVQYEGISIQETLSDALMATATAMFGLSSIVINKS